jgi:thiol-disulfide isomerase/thioredoxin
MDVCLKLLLAWFVVASAGVPLLSQAAPQASQDSVAPPATAQVPAVAEEKPSAIYREAMHPLDTVRSSLDNWSDAELGALAVGIHRAQAACVQSKPENFSGDALYDYAHLCAFGQLWPNADDAAAAYIASGAEIWRAQAYALRISAQVHQNAPESAVKMAEEMLHTLPYDAEVAYALHYLEDDLDQAWNPLSLQLEQEEHSKLLNALRTGAPLKALHSPAELSVGGLFDAGMKLASQLRYSGDEAGAELTAAELRQAVTQASGLPPGDQAAIAAAGARYELLDHRLPRFPVKRPVPVAGALSPVRIGYGKATVFVMFPDWCVQCRRMMKSLTEFATANAAIPIYAYGLMFNDEPAGAPKPPNSHVVEDPRTAPTGLVDAKLATDWGATEFPYAVITNAGGIVQFAGPVPADAFKGDGYIQRVIERMYSQSAGKQQEGDTHW